MKAPDKIYILPMQNPADGYVGITWSDKHGKMTEYIRKDALLEWAESELKSITGNFELAQGGKIVLYMLIDKLKSI